MNNSKALNKHSQSLNQVNAPSYDNNSQLDKRKL